LLNECIETVDNNTQAAVQASFRTNMSIICKMNLLCLKVKHFMLSKMNLLYLKVKHFMLN